MLRPDYIPSNWVLLWYVLYMAGVVTQNPKLAILIGIVFNGIQLLVMAYYKVFLYNILSLAFLICLFKVFPFWTLRNTKIKVSDLYTTLGFFLLYVTWILWEDKTTEVFQALNGLLNNKVETHGMKKLQELFG